jgi:hypothetical protein
MGRSRPWVIVVAAGASALSIGGIVPGVRISGRFVYRLAWGYERLPLIEHLLIASRWAVTIVIPVLGVVAILRSSRFAPGLLLASAALFAVDTVYGGVSVALDDRRSQMEVGSYLTLFGSALVATGAIGVLILGRRDRMSAELPRPT